MLEELYYKTDGIIAKKLLDQIILEAYEIQESGRGMTYRQRQDKFQKLDASKDFPQGSISPLYFLTYALLNNKGKGSYKTKEKTLEEINALAEQEGFEYKEYNSPNTAAIVIIMTDDEMGAGNKFAFVRYFQTLTSDARGKWTQAEFARDTGYAIRAEAGGKLTTTETEKIKLKPVDLIGDEVLRTPDATAVHALQNAQALSGKDLDPVIVANLTELFDAVINNREPKELKGGARYATVYEKYLGEILGSIAFVKNWKISNQEVREKVREMVLGGKNKIENMKISFIMKENEKLLDSTLTLQGKIEKKIFLSSKAESGAASSLVKFNEEIQKLTDEEIAAFAGEHPTFYNILTVIANNNWWDGPIELALQYGLIDNKDKKILDLLKEEKNMPLRRFTLKVKLTKNLNNLMALMAADPKTPGYLPVYHLISGIARGVVKKINETKDFHNGVKAVMNKIGVVQINCSRLRVNNDNCSFSNFVIKYPPVFEGTILADAKKTYMSTYNNGRITFKIP